MLFRLSLMALIFLLAVVNPAAAEKATTIQLGPGTRAEALAFGPDGNLWFTAKTLGSQGFSNAVGRTTIGGEVAEYPLPERDRTEIGGIASGPGGYLWFADTGAAVMGRIGLDGQVAEFPPSPPGRPQDVVVGPDGSIWLTVAGEDRLEAIRSDGSRARVPLPLGADPQGLAVGGDGALWVAERGRNSITRVTPAGAVTEFALANSDSRPSSVVRGGDGNIWFGEEGGHRVGRITPAGELTEFEVPGSIGGIGALASSPNGTVFFVTGTKVVHGAIGSLSPDGDLTGFGCVVAGCNLPMNALTIGPEGRLWYGAGELHTGGGGGTQQGQLYVPGLIGTFDPPPPARVVIPTQSPRLRRRSVAVRLRCAGVERAACTGRLRLVARIQLPDKRRRSNLLIGERRLHVLGGTAESIAVRVREPGLAVLRRRTATRVLITARTDGGSSARRKLTLRLQHRR